MSNQNNQLISVLLTCYNRKETTKACLKSLFSQQLPTDFRLQVYLVDDGSTDGTSEMVAQYFPDINLIRGSGQLFWNGGMRLAWNHAAKENPDFFLWLNDDVVLETGALQEVIDCYQQGKDKCKISCLIIGSCSSTYNEKKLTYGGSTDEGSITPNGELQNCLYINGNIVLVPKEVYQVLGNLSSDYTHGIGDTDYGLRAIQAGFDCYISRKFVGTCEINDRSLEWYSPTLKLKDRWRLFHSPKGLNIKEYNLFRKKFWGWKWITFAFKAYFKLLTPRLYHNLSVYFTNTTTLL